MIEKMKAVNNPLTIIAIFAAFAEVAGTAALAAMDKEVQHIFVWFVMGFPMWLVTLFFITLIFKPNVLYAPSDFKDEQNFMNTLVGTTAVSVKLEEMTKQVEEAKNKIQGLEQSSVTVDAEKQLILDKINQIEMGLTSTRATAVRLTSELASGITSFVIASPTSLERILKFFIDHDEPISSKEIAQHLGIDIAEIRAALSYLNGKGFVQRDVNNDFQVDLYFIDETHRAEAKDFFDRVRAANTNSTFKWYS